MTRGAEHVLALVRFAAQASGVTTSTGLLMLLLGGGVVGAMASAYRFWANYRTTERGMARDRVVQATSNARSAQHEAYLWQSRCADLTFLLRERGVEVPPLDPELQALVAPSRESRTVVDWSFIDHDHPERKRPSP